MLCVYNQCQFSGYHNTSLGTTYRRIHWNCKKEICHLNYKYGACDSETENYYTILQHGVKMLIGVNETGLQYRVSYI